MSKHRSLVLAVIPACAALASAVGLGAIHRDSSSRPMPESEEAQDFSVAESNPHEPDRANIRHRSALRGSVVADHLFCVDGSDTPYKATGRYILDAESAMDGLETDPFCAPVTNVARRPFTPAGGSNSEDLWSIVVADGDSDVPSLLTELPVGVSPLADIALLSSVVSSDFGLIQDPAQCGFSHHMERCDDNGNSPALIMLGTQEYGH